MSRVHGDDPLTNLALVVSVLACFVVLTSPVQADGGFGCLGANSRCNQEENGFCQGAANPDRCTCVNPLSGHTTDTCDCSTREYPPCARAD